jgi:hypothetical protein
MKIKFYFCSKHEEFEFEYARVKITGICEVQHALEKTMPLGAIF